MSLFLFLPGVQHHDERHQDRGGRGAGHNGPVLPHRDHLHYMVHVRVVRALPRVPQQAQFLPGRHEHHRHHRHHSVFHHAGDCRRRGGGYAQPPQGTRLAPG